MMTMTNNKEFYIITYLERIQLYPKNISDMEILDKLFREKKTKITYLYTYDLNKFFNVIINSSIVLGTCICLILFFTFNSNLDLKTKLKKETCLSAEIDTNTISKLDKNVCSSLVLPENFGINFVIIDNSLISRFAIIKFFT